MKTIVATVVVGILMLVFMLLQWNLAKLRIPMQLGYQQVVVVPPGSYATKLWVRPQAGIEIQR